MSSPKKGCLIVLSGPSGAGKDSILSKILKDRKDLKLSVSHTTRLPRKGEVQGKDYFFVTREEFESRALLYHILMDLEEFLMFKKRFVEGLDGKTLERYWKKNLEKREKGEKQI